MFNRVLIFVLLISVGPIARAEDWARPNPAAPQGGTFKFHLDSDPTNLHPILSGDLSAWLVSLYTHDTLCSSDISTNEVTPKIASAWTVSKDGLEYIFSLRENVVFHNNAALTADDVLFTFAAFRDPEYKQGFWVEYLAGIAAIEAPSKYQVKFKFKEKNYKNLETLCSLQILPKSVYGDTKKSLKMLRQSIGAGPYKLEKYNKGQFVMLKRFAPYYGFKTEKGFNNFEQVIFKITTDTHLALEKMKKGELDYMEISTLDDYLKLNDGKFNPELKFKNFTARAVQNKMPWSINYIAMNNKDDILKDPEVRRALAHLVNRTELNQKLYSGLKEISNGPIPSDLPEASASAPIDYNPKKAQKILKAAGWTDEDKNSILEKTIGGVKRELRLNVIYPSQSYEKILTTIQQSFQQNGIVLDLKILEPISYFKKIEDDNIQLFTQGWGSQDPEQDPKFRWHSTANGVGGLNRWHYANAKVDKWIEQGRIELDKKKRQELFKKAYTQIAEDSPALFLFYNKYYFYAVSNRVEIPGPTFKYDFGIKTWWAKQ